MSAPSRLPAATGMDPRLDPRLEPFLRADDEAGADGALTRLMAEVETFLERAVRRCTRSSRGAGDDGFEDVVSVARGSLVARLRRLRAGGAGLPPIGDLEAYVGAVARTAWATEMRGRHPRRAALVNRLQYLLENRTGQRGFALWDGPDGHVWAGFEEWRGREETGGRPADDRPAFLAVDPRALTAEIFGPGIDPTSLHLAELVSRVFSWLGGPLPLRELISAAALWQGIAAAVESLHAEEDGDPFVPCAVPDPGLSPHDELRWREYLRWLWDATARLSLPQRTAFLLHSSCLRELELLGLTSVRRAAERLEISPLLMAEYWNTIPLADRLIAALLRVDVQRVINLRRMARETLGRAWHGFLHEK